MQGATASGYAFTGREWDAEVGLYYYRARYFDPASARFRSPDPIGFSGGANLYGYVKNGPSGATDPSGLIALHPGDVLDWWAFAEDLSRFLDCRSWSNGGWLTLSTISLLPGLTGLGMIDDVARARGGLGNPFKKKSAAQIDQMLRAKGYRPAGPDPLSGRGGYVNPTNGRSYHIDEANSYGEPSHVDVNRLKTYEGPLDKKKYLMGK